ncbi:unnamed protein product [Menidia menidia]|uniref:(Atlantic silverside) hypothetical protein n=1 Tax=Menidia menidia TaxID=238744 RepID=A0A8S4B847_9TELE|nr:unnamed protein product [Menidia menidia]
MAHGADPDHHPPHLGSPLYVSCLHRHTDCSRALLLRGASVNVGLGGDSPLHAAARLDSADQVAVLLDFGADVNARDGDGQRPAELTPAGGRAGQLLLAFEGRKLDFQAESRSQSALFLKSLCLLCRLRIRSVIGRSYFRVSGGAAALESCQIRVRGGGGQTAGYERRAGCWRR